MQKKWFYIILIPALIIISGYMALRIYLERSVSPGNIKMESAIPGTASIDTAKANPLDLRPLFIKKMQQLITSGTNNLYNLTVGDMKVDLLASKVSLFNVTLAPNSQQLNTLKEQGKRPQQIVTVKLKQLYLDGVNLDDALHSRTLKFSTLRLLNPEITVDEDGQNKKNAHPQEFARSFLKNMDKLQIDHIVVENAQILSTNDHKKNITLKKVNATLSHILIDSTTREDKNRFLFAREAKISINGFSTQTKDRFYNICIGTINVEAPEQKVTLKDLSITSPYDRTTFEHKHRYGASLYNLHIPSVSLTRVNWWTLINQEEVVAGSMTVPNAKLTAFYDRSMPSSSSTGTFPSQLLMKAPVKIDIGDVHLQNFDLSYQEYSPHSRQLGTIFFKQTELNMHHVNNQPSDAANITTVNGNTLFMGKVPLKAKFEFDINKVRTGDFNVTLHSDGFDGTVVNSFAEPLGLTKMDGQLHSLDTHIHGNQEKAQGDVTLLYDNLKITMLEENKAKTGINKKHVTSFLANTFVLKKDNPSKGKEPRIENGQYDRKPVDSFFMLVWKTIIVGALKTIGAPPSYAH